MRYVALLTLCVILVPTQSALGQSDQEPPTGIIVSEKFQPQSETWEVVSGSWSVVEGTYSTNQGGAADISRIVAYRHLHPAQPPSTQLPFEQFTYRARMLNEGVTNSELGLVFLYQDPANYYEAVVSTPGGVVSLRRVINGFITTLATASRGALAPRTWIEMQVRWNDGRTTVHVDGALVFFEIVQSEFTVGQVGVISHGGFGRFDQAWVGVPFGDQPFKEDFSDGIANGWNPQSGQWAVAGGTYDNASVEQTNVTLASITTANWATITYTLRARMLNPFRGSGNLVGIVFNYRGPLNYSELVFSPTGIARINQITDGVRTTLASTTYDGRRNVWFDVRFENVFAITVRVDGEVIFENVPANPGIAPEGRVGLITHWAPGRFDDVWFEHGAVGSGICTADFSDGLFPGRALSGAWNTTGGTLNSTAVGETDIAAGFCGGGDGVTYRARLLNQFGASGNLVGLVFSHQDVNALYAGDYFEVVFSPTGTVRIRKFLHGVRYVVASGSHNIPRNVWFDVEVIRNGINTTVKANGQTLIADVPLGGLPSGAAGAVTHWSRGRFDDLSAVQHVER